VHQSVCGFHGNCGFRGQRHRFDAEVTFRRHARIGLCSYTTDMFLQLSFTFLFPKVDSTRPL